MLCTLLSGAPHHMTAVANEPRDLETFRKRLQAIAPGQVMRVMADDPVAVIDIPHFCTEAGHVLIDSTVSDVEQVYFIRKTG